MSAADADVAGKERNMTTLTELMQSPDMHRRLRDARGTAPVLIVYRGGATGRYSVGDDGRGGIGEASIQECFDEILAVAGLEMADANAFCSEHRTTLTLKMRIAEGKAELALYHDTLTGRTDMQILHPEPVTVRMGSYSDMLALHADPHALLAHHFDEADASEVRRVLERLGLVPEPPTGEEMEYDAHAVALRPGHGD